VAIHGRFDVTWYLVETITAHQFGAWGCSKDERGRTYVHAAAEPTFERAPPVVFYPAGEFGVLYLVDNIGDVNILAVSISDFWEWIPMRVPRAHLPGTFVPFAPIARDAQ
jgi:hypothetical protein